MTSNLPTYEVHRARVRPELAGEWDGPAWAQAAPLPIACFRPESSDHRPVTAARLLYDDEAFYGIFLVQDRYVRGRFTRFQDPVWRDSCVEFFVQPGGAGPYFNFEFACGGAFLAHYVTDPRRSGGKVAGFTPLVESDAAAVRVYHSLPAVVEPEITQPVAWHLEFAIPLALLAKYAEFSRPAAGHVWRANFYKCAEENSHPHWAAWAPVDELNFHLPRCFGTLRFAAE
jgi:hypothetical protein